MTRFVIHFVAMFLLTSCPLVCHAAPPAAAPAPAKPAPPQIPDVLPCMKITLGPERIIFTDAIQPFAIQSSNGNLIIHAQLRFPPGFQWPKENAYPGILGAIISQNQGASWQRWLHKPKDSSFAPTDNAVINAVLSPADPGPISEGASVQLKNGPVLIQEWTAHKGPDKQGNYTCRLWESFDNLQTFSGPIDSHIALPGSKGGFDDCGHPYSGLTFHRTILQLPSGDLLACVYCWFESDNTPCTYEPKMNKFRAVLLRSSDNARHWRYISTIASDPVGEEGFNEPVMARIPAAGPHAGRLVCLIRTGRDNHPVYQSHSDNDGATWSPAHPIHLHGVDPELLALPNGTLIALVGRRILNDAKNQRGYYLASSSDAGQTWTDLAKWNIEPHSGTDNTTYYCSLRQVAPNKLLAFYDIGTWTQPVRYTAQREITLH